MKIKEELKTISEKIKSELEELKSICNIPENNKEIRNKRLEEKYKNISHQA